MIEEKKTRISTDWQQYEAGAPDGIQESMDLLRTETVRLRHIMDSFTLFLQQETDDKGKGEGEKPIKPQDNSEAPDTGPWMDCPNYKAKIRAIRTDANGAYQGTTLEAQEDIPKVGNKGTIMILHNKNWESEFKRAQNTNKLICLRVCDGKVQSIEVLD